MRPDPVYVTDVSNAIKGAVREAQGLMQEGELGAPLRDVVRHARELHDVLVEELATGPRRVGEHADDALVEMGERLRTLEQYLHAH